MPMPEITALWPFECFGASMDATTDRLNVPPGMFPELWGLDGRTMDGVRPFPGFLFLVELDMALNDERVPQPPPGYAVTDLALKNLFPFLIRTGRQQFVDGFVWRVSYPDGTSRVYVSWRPAGTAGTYVTKVLADHLTPDPRSDGNNRASFTVAGRTGYFFISGSPPIAFWFTNPAARGEHLRVYTRPGSGRAPSVRYFPMPIASKSVSRLTSGSGYLHSGTNSYGNTASNPANHPGDNFLNLAPPPGNEVQEIQQVTPADSGTWKIRARGPDGSVLGTTGPLAYNVTQSALQSALVALYGAGNVVVSGNHLRFTVEFTGGYASTDMPLMEVVENTVTYNVPGVGAVPTIIRVRTIEHAGSANVGVYPFSFFFAQDASPQIPAPPVEDFLTGPTNFQATGPGLYQTNVAGSGGAARLVDPVFAPFASRRRVAGPQLQGVDDVAYAAKKVSLRPGAVDVGRRYGYVFQLWDQFRSGRFSKPSETLTVPFFGTGYEPFRSPAMEVRQTQGTPVGGGEQTTASYLVATGNKCVFPGIEIVYDPNIYDTLLVWRTVGDLPSGPLSLDGMHRLDRFRTTNQMVGVGEPLPTPWVRAFVLDGADDSFIASQVSFDPAFLTLEAEMPHGGAGLFHEGVMYVGDILVSQTNRDPTGASVIRWSMTSRVSPENFSSLAFYPLARPGDEVLVFLPLGPAVVALARENVYLVRREGTAMRVYHLLSGTGVFNRRAAVSVGGTVFFASETGLYTISGDGAVDTIKHVEQVFRRRWVNSGLDDISLAYCQQTRALYVHHKSRREALVLFMETGRTTFLADMWFDVCVGGPAPRDVNTVGDIRHYALFTQFVVSDRVRLRLYRPDVHGQKIIVAPGTPDHGKRALSLMHPVGVIGYLVVKETFAPEDPIGAVLVVKRDSFGSGPVSRLRRCAVYVARASNRRLEGNRAYITQATMYSDRVELVLEDGRPLSGLMPDDFLFLSPVFVEVVGWAVGHLLGIPDGVGRDRLYTRRVTSIYPVFAEVRGPPSMYTPGAPLYVKLACFQGVVYEGHEMRARGIPRDPNGQPRVSLVDGVAAVGAPLRPPNGVLGNPLYASVRVFSTNVFYQLLSFSVEGTILETRRKTLPGRAT